MEGQESLRSWREENHSGERGLWVNREGTEAKGKLMTERT